MNIAAFSSSSSAADSLLFLQLKFYITVQQSPVLKKRNSSRMIPEILLILFF